MPISTCVFDAYGTLFDVNAAARNLAEEDGLEGFAAVWQQVSSHWRNKQLQYSWIRAITRDHVDFWQVTQDALDWALDVTDQANPALRDRLLGLYWTLPAYPEVPEMLATLKAGGLQTAILSNGSPRMLEGAVDSAGIGPVLDEVLSVEDEGIFKPDARVYGLVGRHFDVPKNEVLFVSSNGWDAASAASYGFQVLWVNRAGEPMDRLPGQPGQVAEDLTSVPEMAGLARG
ncbi:haloacid dehalogenase type II [Roseobacter sp. HKCCD9010]|uniref:haloacid dehalogenase type II n=1 Tax=unclassified Roseobacter TaxID=196798 RepID=UPI001490E2CD|nr:MULTISPECIES: haloacid dehalogenase type II [unclassified Roseobacter]MBF9049941.1 haloacid dehalogenase type II [Rhodobacterales bacterium HKCCD4356]NNV13520.1 haloacid dehalogenase type II [Roseobacter sp. HKCCD7357]NNV16353.1 haloacid dehalogenase type II [Roseobacter sp. HKCCD8768]NNV25813.1 haloacid dehalogenase type II [Roseobacter sp. HKCCD8192]NNV30069.1 haloacid dehalogenase type II [Roseobacter sp. HKCCD9061]